MKVIYRKSMIDQLDAAVTAAQLDGRVIERFELSESEMKQLEGELNPHVAFRELGGLFFTSYRGIGVQKV